MIIKVAASSGATSLLELPLESWKSKLLAQYGAGGLGKRALAFLRYAHTRADDLAHGSGWEREYPEDVWELRRLGIEGRSIARLRFDRISQLWLRDLAKRQARWRLSVGISVRQVDLEIRAITRLSRSLTINDIESPAGVNRALLERHLADLTTTLSNPHSRARDIGCLSVFLQSVRRHGWEPDLPTTAALYADDFPRQPEQLPRALAEHVMAQVEDPENLDRWTNPTGRAVTLLLMRCGLRVGDACCLDFDCIVRDEDGAAYLRYTNRKMGREALVPIDEDTEAEVVAQQRRVLERWPDGSRWLFHARVSNPDGDNHLTSNSYRYQLRKWLERCDVRDEHGQPARLTPHQWRHTFGTRLINRDVPQHVVQRLLDHTSPEMTAHYARLHDITVRRHWEAARQVNIEGADVSLDIGGTLVADAARTREALARATQALPNGCCGLPAQNRCPHANACLTCPMFVTTPEYLPQHRQHREQLLQIVSVAQERGQTRVAEMNRQVLCNLDKIITRLENEEVSADAG